MAVSAGTAASQSLRGAALLRTASPFQSAGAATRRMLGTTAAPSARSCLRTARSSAAVPAVPAGPAIPPRHSSPSSWGRRPSEHAAGTARDGSVHDSARSCFGAGGPGSGTASGSRLASPLSSVCSYDDDDDPDGPIARPTAGSVDGWSSDDDDAGADQADPTGMASSMSDPADGLSHGRTRQRHPTGASAAAALALQPQPPDSAHDPADLPGLPARGVAVADAAAAAAAGEEVSNPAAERAGVFLLPPSVPGLPATVEFGHTGGREERLRDGLVPLPPEMKMLVKLGGAANNALKHALWHAGFKRTQIVQRANLVWSGTLRTDEFAVIKAHQKVNHFPGTFELGRKDRLYANLAAARRSRGAAFDVCPAHFILPQDAARFRAEASDNPDRVFILKPAASSRGRGIRIVTDTRQLPTELAVIQEYIANPHLINGLKYDIRLYVLVTSFDPLRSYIFEDGLVRFATEPYRHGRAALRRKYMHLTNTSLNKSRPGYVSNTSEEADGEGSKWSLKALAAHFREQLGVDWEPIQARIRDVVAATLIAVEPKVNAQVRTHLPHQGTCFEVFGFDILLDADHRAWLIEVNTGPDLTSPSPLDRRVKASLVSDALSLVGLVPTSRAATRKAERRETWERLEGGSSRAQLSRADRVSSAEIPSMNLADMPPEDLPLVVRQTEGEHCRRGRWQFLFPDPEDPQRYQNLFETPRPNNLLVAHYLLQKRRQRQRRRQQRALVRQGAPAAGEDRTSSCRLDQPPRRQKTFDRIVANQAADAAVLSAVAAEGVANMVSVLRQADEIRALAGRRQS